jgi:glycosyltransferase involved in cell wall biosynthesis
VGRGDSHIRHLLPSGLGIEVTGPVEDARPEIAAASLVIAPLRAGSGTRIKILEAWSAARPVLATPLAAEGLEVREGGPDANIALANTPEQFAGSVADLLEDPDRLESLGTNGRRTFEQRYTWQAAWSSLDRIWRDPQVRISSELSRYTG